MGSDEIVSQELFMRRVPVQPVEKDPKLLKLLDKNDMLHILLLRLNESIPRISKTTDMSGNPFIRMFGDLDPDYLIAFNVGAIWNVIFKWVHKGMKESPDQIRDIIRTYILSSVSYITDSSKN